MQMLINRKNHPKIVKPSIVNIYLRKVQRIRLGIVVFMLIILYTVLFIVFANYLMPLMGEDLALSIPFENKNDGVLEILPQITDRIIFQSTHWNARLGEQLAIIFSSIDKHIFNFLNIIITFSLLYLIVIYAKGKLEKVNIKNIFLLIFSLAVLFLLPNIGDLLFWISVATNYLWSIFLLLLFLLPYRLLWSGMDIYANTSILIRILSLPIAVLAGMTNENTVIAVMIMIIGAFLVIKVNLFKVDSIPGWYWRNFALLSVGYAYLLFSPSTTIRREYYQQSLDIQINSIKDILNNIHTVFDQYLMNSKNLLVVLTGFLILLVGFLLFRRNNKPSQLNNLLITSAIAIASFISVAVLIVAPYLETRALLFNWIFLIIFILAIINETYFIEPKSIFFPIMVIIIGLAQTPTILHCVGNLSSESAIREEQLFTQKEFGLDEIQVNRFKYECPMIFSSREDWRILFIHDENYYGVKDIKIIDN